MPTPPVIIDIGISSLAEDRVTKWECPDCHQQWDRD